MSVVMSEAEIAAFLSEAMIATVISINPGGMPLPAPVYFASRGSELFFSTMRKTQKAKNLARDPRIVVQVEAGEKYRELRAVILTGTAREASADDAAFFQSARDQKYGVAKTNMAKLPEASQKHYDNPRAIFHVVPDKVKSWDNRKLRMPGT